MNKITTLLGILILLCFSGNLKADPCGMVPPMIVANDNSQYLTRVGDQVTFAFFKDGIEDVVLRPAFKGSVEEFGMLIPFPSVPAIRKASDDILQQVAMAVEPPSVTIDLRWRYRKKGLPQVMKEKSKKMSYAVVDNIKKDEVRVLKKEAVGMYQVAVLEAGSPKALERWMTEHSYMYPKGMDSAVNHYVNEKWVFVAIKAKIGDKQGMEPQPGMRDTTKGKLPNNSVFTGAVQAMGFRFTSDQAIIPMRLSSYNPGELHNIVYFLGDGPCRVNQLSKSFIKQQISGSTLLDHLNNLLPAKYLLPNGKTINVGCGESATLPTDKANWTKDQDKKRRDPSIYNAKAKELFLSDILAVHNKTLEHDYEKRAKELLNISEELGLRGKDVDAILAVESKEGQKIREETLSNILKKMTLTVIKGDFPRETLRNNDLTFVSYTQPVKNIKKGGFGFFNYSPLTTAILLVFIATIFVFKKTKLKLLIVLLSTSLIAVNAVEDKGPSEELLQLLSDKEKSQNLVEALSTGGSNAVPALASFVSDKTNDILARGRALICLKKIKNSKASPSLANLYNDKNEKDVLRLWAAASWLSVNPEKALDGILSNPHQQTMVNLNTRIGRATIEQKKQILSNYINQQFSQIDYNMFNALNNLIVKESRNFAPALAKLCLKGSNNNVRRSAAAYLGSPQIKSDESLTIYLELLSYNNKKNANHSPWHGGALFVPGIQWGPKKGSNLSANLIHWMLWAESKNDNENIQQIRNNIAAVGNQMGIAGWNKVWSMKGSDWVLAWVNKFALPNGKISSDKNTIASAITLLSHGIASDKNNSATYIDKLQELYGVKK